jgi:hypothetical protein
LDAALASVADAVIVDVDVDEPSDLRERDVLNGAQPLTVDDLRDRRQAQCYAERFVRLRVD